MQKFIRAIFVIHKCMPYIQALCTTVLSSANSLEFINHSYSLSKYLAFGSCILEMEKINDHNSVVHITTYCEI